MPHERYELRHVADEALLDQLRCIIKQDRALTAKLLTYMAEVDARSLYADEAMPSMFRFCTERLGMAEGQAYNRIAACRAARKFPKILELIARGQLHVTGVKLLAPHLTQENQEDLLEAAKGRTVRAIEHLIAQRFPQPDARTTIRKLPERPPLVVDVPPAPRPSNSSQVGIVTPTRVERDDSEQGAPDGERSAAPKSRYKVQFAADRSFVDKLDRAKGLLRHKVPDGRLEAVLEEALDVLLLSLEKQKFKTTDRPRKTKAKSRKVGSRYIPNEVKRQVYHRDGGRCTYVDAQGRRCPETEQLQYHHREPHGKGGPATARNMTLYCASHNQRDAHLEYGREHIERATRTRRLETLVSERAPATGPPG